MAFFDLAQDQLVDYRPQVAEPDGFEQFWDEQVHQLRQQDRQVQCEPVDNHQSLVEASDVTFTGADGTRVHAWLLTPAGATGPLPTVVEYIGYGGSRGWPTATPYVAAGFAQLVMDSRGQGISHSSIFEVTDDASPAAGAAGVPGMMTRGLLDPKTYYFRRLYLDAFAALEVARTLPQVDAERIYLIGGSQGGGLTIAAAGLAGMQQVPIAGALPDVPFLCHFARAVTITDADPYAELARYFARRPFEIEAAMHTLAHVDAVNFAKRATAPALFSVALMDQVCPPSTVYAAYNQWGAATGTEPDKHINVYPFNGHEGGGELQIWEKLIWLRVRAGIEKPARQPRRCR